MQRHLVYGFHSVRKLVALRPAAVLEAWLQQRGGKQDDLRRQLEALGIPLHRAQRRQLDEMSGGGNHQGVVLAVRPPRALGDADLKDLVRSEGNDCLLLVLDGVQDPHNLGACLRVADGAGVSAVVVPRDKSVGLTAAVAKVASGAAYSVPLIRVANLARTLRWLAEQGVWLVGTAGGAATTLYGLASRLPMAVVLGSENKGLRRLTRERCDVLVAIPMGGMVESLNLSVAAGIVLFEVRRQLGSR